jgi:putative ABC transport system substrate-binding protein
MRVTRLAVVLSLGLVFCPHIAKAQAAKIPRVGYLVLAPLSDVPSPERAAFLAGLHELGWIEGKTIAIEYRSANWNTELLDDLAEELVGMKVDLILAAGGSAVAVAAKRSTSTIPIVMTGSGDPVAERLVTSMRRPGGNVTGMSSMLPELGAKRIELLKEAVPRIARLSVLLNPVTSVKLELAATQAAARRLGVALKLMEVRNADDLGRVFAALDKERPDALTMFADMKSSGYRVLVGDFAKQRKLPTIFGAREFAEAGGLISYAPNFDEAFRRTAGYVDISKHVGRVNSEPIVVDEIVA